MLVISKRLKQSLGINIKTIPIRIGNSLVWDLVLADALAALVALDVLTVLIVLTALVASVALTALVVLAAQVAPDAAAAVVAVEASKPIRLVFLRETHAFLQGSFSIR